MNESVQRAINTLVQVWGWEAALRALAALAWRRSHDEAAAGRTDAAWKWVQLGEVLRRCHSSYLPRDENPTPGGLCRGGA